MESHLKSYWLAYVNRLMPLWIFFVWIYRSTSQEINIPCLFAKFEANIAELDTVTVSGRSFKIYSRVLDFNLA